VWGPQTPVFFGRHGASRRGDMVCFHPVPETFFGEAPIYTCSYGVFFERDQRFSQPRLTERTTNDAGELIETVRHCAIVFLSRSSWFSVGTSDAHPLSCGPRAVLPGHKGSVFPAAPQVPTGNGSVSQLSFRFAPCHLQHLFSCSPLQRCFPISHTRFFPRRVPPFLFFSP